MADTLNDPDPTPSDPVDLPAPDEAPPFANVPSDYFHAVNHELRTIELAGVPRGAARALSVGANGRWYFDWFEAAVGTLERHIGIEAFEPKPSDLPDYVTWIPDTADHMDGVADGEVDLVFAGQTTEHLWAHELSGFLIEAHRVLSGNGVLVLDSPNRLVTEFLAWSHGGHTIELSAGEIGELLDLAGFDVESVHGIWRCRFGEVVVQLEEGLADGATVVHRIADAPGNVDDSFIWWINARRSSRQPRVDELNRRTWELFELHWPTRVTRGLFPHPGAVELPLALGDSGLVGSTLPFPIHGGRWRLELEATTGALTNVHGIQVRFVAPGGVVLHELCGRDATERAHGLSWEFDQGELTFAVVLQIHVDGVTSPTHVALPISLFPVPRAQPLTGS